jgi:hypothetical protein
MRQIKFLGLTILLCCFIGCGDSGKKKTEPATASNWKTINETDYSIRYPDSLELQKPGQMGMNFMLLTKQTSAKDLFRENINLIIQDLAGQNVGLDQYVEVSEGQIKSMLTDGMLIESKRVKENFEYQRLVYTGKQGQYSLKWLQYYWLEKSKAYVLTLTCEENQFDKYLPTCEQVMNSFKIE